MPSREVCVDCNGNGKCAACDGTGINPHLNEAEPKCRDCSGTGVCPTCHGAGRTYLVPPPIQDLGLNK